MDKSIVNKLTPARIEIIKEYWQLALLASLSERDEERLLEILEQAESDNILSALLAEADYWIASELNLLNKSTIRSYRIQQEKLIQRLASIELDEQEFDLGLEAPKP